jgi:hypothetical protein
VNFSSFFFYPFQTSAIRLIAINDTCAESRISKSQCSLYFVLCGFFA